MQENNPLVFRYIDIEAEGGLNVKLEPAPAGYADLFDRPGALKKINLELYFSIGTDSIFLEGRASAELEMECSRCTGLLVRSFGDSFDEVYPDTVECIDTRETIRETIGLLAPMKVLCSENCKGRCLVCGINRNRQICACKPGRAGAPPLSGPRFGALKELKLEKRDKPGKKDI